MPKPQRTKRTSKTNTPGARRAATQARVATPRGKAKAAASPKSTTGKLAKTKRGAKVTPSSKRAAAKGRATMSAAKPNAAARGTSAAKKTARAKQVTGARGKAAAPAKGVKRAAKKSPTTRSGSSAKAKNGLPKAPRRDATGHLNPKYARDLRALSREGRDKDGEDRAFFRTSRSGDDLAEELGEEAVATMTTGEDQSERFEKEVDEERGGPFIKTRSRDEFARGTDRSNPRGSTREPFPRT